MAFLGFDLSNFSLEDDAKPSAFWGRSGIVEIHKIDPDGKEIHEEAPDEALEIEAGCGRM